MIAQIVQYDKKFVACNMVSLAIDLLHASMALSQKLLASGIFPDFELKIRIGLNIGPCNEIINSTTFEKDFFGHMVNTASRMESTGKPNRIQLTEALYSHICDMYDFEKDQHNFEVNQQEIKGLGLLCTYYIQETNHVQTANRCESFAKKSSSRAKLLRTNSCGSIREIMRQPEPVTQSKSVTSIDDNGYLPFKKSY